MSKQSKQVKVIEGSVGAAIVNHALGTLELANFADAIARRIFKDADAKAASIYREQVKAGKGYAGGEGEMLLTEAQTLNGIFKDLSKQYRTEAEAFLGNDVVAMVRKAIKGVKLDGWDGLKGDKQKVAYALRSLTQRMSEAKRLYVANLSGHPAVAAWLAGDASRDAAIKALGGADKAEGKGTKAEATANDFARMLEAAVNGLLDRGESIRDIVNKAVAIADAKEQA